MKFFYRLFSLILLVFLTIPMMASSAAPNLQQNTPEQNAKALLDTLRPEERVGQLFLMTFNGPEAGPSTAIYNLIVNYHIGGVILTSADDNFISADQTLPVALNLNRQLQIAEYQASQQLITTTVDTTPFNPAYIPLLIGISQEGDGYPYDQILSGLTPLPSEMAIGATWKPQLAEDVGNVLGKELSTLGFNLLLGPSLDVLDPHVSEGGGDLGIRTYGGDPFWVGLMGKAFITGVHEGSQGQMAVVATHFPGYGSSDRLPEEEVATIRKSLEELKQIDLDPFFAVTGNAPDDLSRADALLTSHIRIQGFQENIRRTTKPVTFDHDAFSQLMSLPELNTWRDSNGVMISDDLGGTPVRKFYESTGQQFIGRYVARDAFLAGNDLLYIGDFSTPDESAPYANVSNTLDFFTQKYREDTAFAQRVDESVLRILTMKFRLYQNNFSLGNVLPTSEIPGFIGKSGQVSFEVEKQAATLLSPSNSDLAAVLPDPPARYEKIVFITDSRMQRQCSKCPLQASMTAEALQQAVIRLYSPQAGGQIQPNDLTSYSFDDLEKMLTTTPGTLQIENDIKQARWLVFSMVNINSNAPTSEAIKQFLANRPDLLQDKHIIAFAFNAPYFLDATDISKLTAYYALYSKTPKAIEVAARLLAQEAIPSGALPVSVQGIGYDLNKALFPAPDQVIPLMTDLPTQTTNQSTATPQPTQDLNYTIGDTIPVRTGVILDTNGNPVPDKTIARFIITHGENSQAPQMIETQTVQGIARTSFKLDSPGIYRVRVESEPAKSSTELLFDVEALNIQGTPVTPTPSPSPTSTSSPTPTLEPTITPTLTPVAKNDHTDMTDWIIVLLVASAIGGVTYYLAIVAGQIRWGVRGGFLALIGSLLAYAYLALGMPGSISIIQDGGILGIIGITLLGAGLGWGTALGWRGIKK